MVKLRFASMTMSLAAGVTAAVVAASSVGVYAYASHHYETLVDHARKSALAEGDLIRVALEHQMLENDRTLLARMMATFGNQARVEQLLLLDRNGTKRYSAGPRPTKEDLRIESPTCQACHRDPPERRGNSRIVETQGGSVLRTVIPIQNRVECHRCHDPAHRINGILIMDYNAGEVQAAMGRELGWTIAGTAAVTLLLVGAIGLLIRVFVLRRLQRIEMTARQIAAGDLERRVPTEGSDTLSWLAREFNTMADSVTGLVGEVRTERERLEMVINSIDDGIVVLDTGRRVIAANDAFLRRIDQSRERVLGCCCRTIDAPGSCEVGDCPTLACLGSGAAQVRICDRRRPDGEVVWEEVHASPILDGSGQLRQVVEVWRDISERRAAEAHLAESHRLASLGMLASGFSHELNTPLGTVLTCVEGILREMPAGKDTAIDSDRVRENASIAREQILRCGGITQNFLRMSRGQKSTADVIDLAVVVPAVERLVSPTARAASVVVEVRMAEGSVPVQADEAELQNVIVNLMLNAIHACRAGGRVTVSVVAGNPVRIRVVDDGCGIAPEWRKRIFEPFVSMREGGTGLGLFLSLNAVRRFGGEIQLESTPGKGSTFEVLLPAFAPLEDRLK